MFVRFMLRRLKEPSTWAGIVTAATAMAGWNLEPEQREAVIALGVSLVGVLLAFVRESGETEAARADKAAEAIEAAVADAPAPTETPAARPGALGGISADPAPKPKPEPPKPTRGLLGRIGRGR